MSLKLVSNYHIPSHISSVFNMVKDLPHIQNFVAAVQPSNSALVLGCADLDVVFELCM